MYLRTRIATDLTDTDGEGVLGRVMRQFIADANASYRGKLHLVDWWYIEFTEDGLPHREIGVDVSGVPIVAGPSSADYGFWSDTNMTRPDLDGDEVDQQEFESLWIQSDVEL